MAKNLWAKSNPGDSLVIFDKDESVTARFVSDFGTTKSSDAAGGKTANIELASSEREVAERSVGLSFRSGSLTYASYDDSDFQPHMI